MQCQNCGPSKDYDLVYSCNRCPNHYCQNHFQNHDCVSRMQTSPQMAPLFNAFKRMNIPRREPTNADYERYLLANPQILSLGKERVDLFVAMVLISLVIGLRPLIFGTSSFEFVALLILVITPAFILHELAHKYVAIRYGKYARFALVRQMTMITLMVALIGFGIAGPGATMIMGKSTKREMGIFAAAGPGLNFVLTMISFLLLQIFSEITLGGMALSTVFLFSMYINSILALFNLIPVSLLDGKKIIQWNVAVWGILVFLNILGFLYSQDVINTIVNL